MTYSDSDTISLTLSDYHLLSLLFTYSDLLILNVSHPHFSWALTHSESYSLLLTHIYTDSDYNLLWQSLTPTLSHSQ